jgi:hypothetical protein
LGHGSAFSHTLIAQPIVRTTTSRVLVVVSRVDGWTIGAVAGNTTMHAIAHAGDVRVMRSSLETNGLSERVLH